MRLHSMTVSTPCLSTPRTSINPYTVCSSRLTGTNPSSIMWGLDASISLISFSVPFTSMVAPSSSLCDWNE